MSKSLLNIGTFKHKVSSVLNRSAEFASKHMFDKNEETCWNSDQGTPQFIVLDFNRQVKAEYVTMMFQGGFVGQDGFVEVGDSLDLLKKVSVLDDIKDCNDQQQFAIEDSTASRYLKITFDTSTDFYGRVTLYSLDVYGTDDLLVS